MTAIHVKISAAKIIHTPFPNNTSKCKSCKFLTWFLAVATSATSIAKTILVSIAVRIVRKRVNIEKAWLKMKKEQIKETTANPAAIGCRTRTTSRACSTVSTVCWLMPTKAEM